MAKRFISFLLSAVLLISILPAGTYSAAAEGETAVMQETTATETTVPQETTVPEETTPPVVDTGYNGHKASDACIAILKQEEGFSERPYWDYSQWTVGYGTKCPDDMLEKYKADGITEAEAETLLRNHLFFVYKDIVTYMDRNGLTLTQNQFDALVLFSYNCGTGWCYDTSGTLYKAVVKGATGNDMIRAFALWCIAGGQVQDFLLRRRLSEANMYLNNQYSRTPPENYCYVLYDGNGGSVSPKSQGYDANLTAAPFPTPALSGYTFAGWFTQAEGGTQVTVLDASTKGKTLYAQWKDTSGNAPESNEQTVSLTVTVTEDNVNLRKGPGTNYTIVGTANKGKQFVITAVASGSGYTWGQYDGGWVCLKYTNYDSVKDGTSDPETTEPEVTEPTTPPQESVTPTAVSGTVKANGGLCVRTGPGTGYQVVRTAPNGSKVQILEQKTVGSMTWGKISDGWISMKYVVLDSAGEGTTSGGSTPDNSNDSSSSAATVSGTITAVGGLRVRSGAGVSYSIVKTIAKGTKVTITETKTEGSTTWGKISDGWISMEYVKLDGSDSADQTPTAQSGTVKVNGELRIRSGPGTSYAVCGYLYNGNKVQITETKTVGATLWGKIANGWISMDYVVLESGSSNAPANTSAKTVTASCLCVRSGAGTGNQIVGYLYSGSKVEILETKSVGGTTWGRIASGWICMDYVK